MERLLQAAALKVFEAIRASSPSDCFLGEADAVVRPLVRDAGEGGATGGADFIFGREPLTSEIWGATIATLAQVSLFAGGPRGRIVSWSAVTDRFLFRCEFTRRSQSL